MKAVLKSGKIVKDKLAEVFVKIGIAEEITEEIHEKEVKPKELKVNKPKQKRVYKKKIE